MEHKILEVTVKMTVPVMVEDTASHDELSDLLKYELESTLKATILEMKLHAIAPGGEAEVEPSTEPAKEEKYGYEDESN